LVSELNNVSELVENFGSYRSALKAVSARYEAEKLSESAAQRRNELLVTLAVHQLRKAKHSLKLDIRLQNDIAGFFGGIRSAQLSSLELIASLRQENTLKSAVELACESGIGTYIQDKGLVVHRSLLSRLPPPLQIMIWAGSLLSDGLEASDLIRIHAGLGKV